MSGADDRLKALADILHGYSHLCELKEFLAAVGSAIGRESDSQNDAEACVDEIRRYALMTQKLVADSRKNEARADE